MVSMACGRHLLFGFCTTLITLAMGLAWHIIRNAWQHCSSNRRCRSQRNSTVRSSIVWSTAEIINERLMGLGTYPYIWKFLKSQTNLTFQLPKFLWNEFLAVIESSRHKAQRWYLTATVRHKTVDLCGENALIPQCLEPCKGGTYKISLFSIVQSPGAV